MTLEKLQHDMIAAMKSGDTLRKQVLSNCIAAVKNAAIAKQCRDNITENLVDDTLLKEQKTVQEQLDTCPADYIELHDKYEKSLEIIKEYAPQLITDKSTIKRMILQVCRDIEMTKANRGLVMKTIAKELKGKVDMKIANELVGSYLL